MSYPFGLNSAKPNSVVICQKNPKIKLIRKWCYNYVLFKLIIYSEIQFNSVTSPTKYLAAITPRAVLM